MTFIITSLMQEASTTCHGVTCEGNIFWWQAKVQAMSSGTLTEVIQPNNCLICLGGCNSLAHGRKSSCHQDYIPCAGWFIFSKSPQSWSIPAMHPLSRVQRAATDLCVHLWNMLVCQSLLSIQHKADLLWISTRIMVWRLIRARLYTYHLENQADSRLCYS